MAFPYLFTAARTTEPNPALLQAALVGLDASATCNHPTGSALYGVMKATAWLPAQITAAQNAIETCAVWTPQSMAQGTIDVYPIEVRALVLALIDQLNIIRAALPTPLQPITPTQAIAAIRAKAGTL